jgi:hypothetical protein
VFINDFASNMVRNLSRNGVRARVEVSGIRDNVCGCLMTITTETCILYNPGRIGTSRDISYQLARLALRDVNGSDWIGFSLYHIMYHIILSDSERSG